MATIRISEISDLDTFKPIDWKRRSIPMDSFPSGIITAAQIKYDYNLHLEQANKEYELDKLFGIGV